MASTAPAASTHDGDGMATPIFMTTVSAPTNIAVIKYWGKSNAKLNTPINSSLSVTLDQADLRTVTTVAASRRFAQDRLWLNGDEEVGAATNPRFRACVDGVKALATDCTLTSSSGETFVLTKADWQNMSVHISSYNTFPTAAGLASSAAGYSALVAALAHLVHAKEEYQGQLTTIARQGSGSACRSLYGGFVAWRKGGEAPDGSDSLAEQVADEHHWPEFRAVILVVSDAQKDTSSTTGMNTSVETSLLLSHRAAHIVPQRMQDMETAIHAKDFDSFARLTMADSNQFHATCLDTYPPIFYLNDVSRDVIRLVHAYNEYYATTSATTTTCRVAYTFDAGPNAVLYTLEPYLWQVTALMEHFFPASQQNDDDANKSFFHPSEIASHVNQYKLDEDLLAHLKAKLHLKPQIGALKMIYVTKSGPGPQPWQGPLNLDPQTGLNTYKP
jgi:diphosphomevalonate decarboxylase